MNVFTKKSDMLTARQVADRFRCSRQNVTRAARLGLLPGLLIDGRWLFHRTDVRKFRPNRVGRPAKTP